MADARAVAGQARDAARSLRLGMDAQGQTELAALIDGLLGLVAGPGGAALGDALGPLLPEVLAAQGRGDLLGVADLLEFELAPRLEGG